MAFDLPPFCFSLSLCLSLLDSFFAILPPRCLSHRHGEALINDERRNTTQSLVRQQVVHHGTLGD